MCLKRKKKPQTYAVFGAGAGIHQNSSSRVRSLGTGLKITRITLDPLLWLRVLNDEDQLQQYLCARVYPRSQWLGCSVGRCRPKSSQVKEGIQLEYPTLLVLGLPTEGRSTSTSVTHACKEWLSLRTDEGHLAHHQVFDCTDHQLIPRCHLHGYLGGDLLL